MMSERMSTKVTQESFSQYRSLCWQEDQPLAILHQYFENGSDTGLYQHVDFYALYVIRSGRGIHVINNHPYPIRGGDVYITPPGSIVGYRDYHTLRAEAFCFQAQLFSDEELDALSAQAGFHNIIIQGKDHPVENVPDYQMHLSPTDYKLVEVLVEEILAETRRGEKVSVLLVRALLFRMLVFLARARTEAVDVNRVEAGTSVSVALANTLRICESRFNEDLTVPQLAALAFLSPSHFSELFTREVGQPPATYLRGLRLAHAQSLLRTTHLSITEIAQQSGFGGSAQLSRVFKSALNLTPREYRSRFRV
jgi:AraC-like DNA-binding protein/mannose-6-phosphate isomerase-like protein (cupin superfamily)